MTASRNTDAGGVFVLSLSKNDLEGIASTIERLIDLLDAMNADPDLEETGEAEPWLGWTDAGPQALFCNERHDDRELDDEREDVSEDEGADINDKPHDDEELEPSLGRLELIDQGVGSYSGSDWTEPTHNVSCTLLAFDGDGYGLAKQMLRANGVEAYVRTSPGLSKRTFVEREHRMPDGSLMRTFVPVREARS
ncbi:hypothetical protein [Mesorhizobium sp. A556]